MAIATLGHVELLCPNLEESRDHLHDIAGLEESFREDGRIYMRAWGDWSAYTVILREAETNGVGHIAFQTESEADLDRYAERIEEDGYSVEWRDAGEEPKHGKSIRFTLPADFEFELFHEIERANVPEEKKSRLKNQPQKIVERGAGVRRIDHVNLYTPNAVEATEWFQDVLDFKLREEVVNESEEQIASWLSVSPLVHEIAFVDADQTVLNHVAYYLKSQSELFRAADILRDHDVDITGGPGKHGISQANYIYYREPSNNQIELFAGGYLIFDPNWETVTWYPGETEDSLYWWGKERTWSPAETKAHEQE